jgi:hypothetical protein
VVAAEGVHCAGEQEAQLLERYRRDLMLGEVLVDELSEGGPPCHAALAPELLQRSPQRRPRVLLTPEPAALHALRVASARSVPVRPQRRPVSTARPKLEYLALLQHRLTPFSWGEAECGHVVM